MAVLSAAPNGIWRTYTCLQASTAGTKIVANEVQDKQVGTSSAGNLGKPELDVQSRKKFEQAALCGALNGPCRSSASVPYPHLRCAVQCIC